MMSSIVKNDKKVVNAWCMYDWANSVYSLTITTAIFPIYFIAVTGNEGGTVNYFGWEVNNGDAFGYLLSISFLFVALLNPILSSIADLRGNKKRFMQFFCYMGAISCSLLYFFTEENLWVGSLFSVLAAIGFAGSLVFYNAYLPEIATEDKYDYISAKGFALGYVGSVILLVANLALVMFGEKIGISSGEGSRLAFLSVGVWWFGFSQYTFAHLPKGEKRESSENIVNKAFSELSKVWKQTDKLDNLRTFLKSFIFYSMGVQTIMYLAPIFAQKVVKMEDGELIGLMLILQLLAIAGAFLMSKIAKKKGNIFALTITLFLWVIVCVSAFLLGEGMVTQFYILGVLVGVVMGGVQSMSRSTFAKFIPEDTPDKASYFSFYETLEKSSIALGSFVYTSVHMISGSYNISALVMGVFFLIGWVIIRKIPSKSVYHTKL